MASKIEFKENIVVESVTVADNGTVSTALDTYGCTLCGLSLPAGVVSTALTFQTSHDDVTYQALEGSDGNAVSYTVEAQKNYWINPDIFLGWRFIKLVFGSSETGGPLAIPCMLKPLHPIRI